MGDYNSGISKETADTFAKSLNMGFDKDEEKKNKKDAELEAKKKALLQLQNR